MPRLSLSGRSWRHSPGHDAQRYRVASCRQWSPLLMAYTVQPAEPCGFRGCRLCFAFGTSAAVLSDHRISSCLNASIPRCRAQWLRLARHHRSTPDMAASAPTDSHGELQDKAARWKREDWAAVVVERRSDESRPSAARMGTVDWMYTRGADSEGAPEPQVGEIVRGMVTSERRFGVFVRVRGCREEGLVSMFRVRSLHHCNC